jgi:hypothetical protein
MKKIIILLALFTLILGFSTPLFPQAVIEMHLRGAFRSPKKDGWIYVRLEGPPDKIGFQHGYLLAEEIVEAQKVIRLLLEKESGKDWEFFRQAAKNDLWPNIEQEYRNELLGIVEGLNVKGIKMGLPDILVMNAWMEMNPNYLIWYANQKSSEKAPPLRVPAERCSAFVATGSYTKDGKVVIGHNAWTQYLDGSRWNIVFDITPEKGHRVLMDGFPGLIHSGDDFGINSAGIMVTETTISRFSGWNPKGIPEFIRARKAMQYAASLDEFARIMKERNNGGYANNWLVADRKTNEIGSLELGLKHVNFWKKKDGYFAGANFPVDEDLIREETTFDPRNKAESANARRLRWEQLFREYKGKIDVETGKRFLADHLDSFTGKIEPNERTLCGHIDLSPRGLKPWMPEYGLAGTVQAKVCDAALAEKMSFWLAMGHPCGIHFNAMEHLAKHSQFSWQRELLRDLNSSPWTLFATKDNIDSQSKIYRSELCESFHSCRVAPNPSEWN